uniref:Nucleosome assembly protein 1 like 4 n=1 Tax=Ornithorhynchus anatinus TaxID=9258 RepID=A0A6I8NZB7_ORNAN
AEGGAGSRAPPLPPPPRLGASDWPRPGPSRPLPPAGRANEGGRCCGAARAGQAAAQWEAPWLAAAGGRGGGPSGKAAAAQLPQRRGTDGRATAGRDGPGRAGGGTVVVVAAAGVSLPRAVKRRIDALKQLQVKCAHIEARFYEEVHDLERKYAAFYQPLFDKRRDFVTGDVEPTDAESEWHSEGEEEEKLAGQLKSSVVITDQEPPAEEPNPKGIPEFWFTIFRNVDMLSELVQEYDEPILKHLQDIKVKFSEPGQPMAFMLEFHFEANDYFTNSVLTKTYKMKSEPDTTDPFSFEGPEIVDCEGCAIEWKRGKNVTVKTIKKKQKHKGRGTVRTVTKQVPSDSFFNFFSPIRASGDGEALDEDSEFTLATDFEIGHFFRERVVPRAVLYFTGEAIEDDENFEEGEEGEEEV